MGFPSSFHLNWITGKPNKRYSSSLVYHLWHICSSSLLVDRLVWYDLSLWTANLREPKSTYYIYNSQIIEISISYVISNRHFTIEKKGEKTIYIHFEGYDTSDTEDDEEEIVKNINEDVSEEGNSKCEDNGDKNNNNGDNDEDEKSSNISSDEFVSKFKEAIEKKKKEIEVKETKRREEKAKRKQEKLNWESFMEREEEKDRLRKAARIEREKSGKVLIEEITVWG